MFAGYHPDHFWDPDDFRSLPPVVGSAGLSSSGGVGESAQRSSSKNVDATCKTMSVKELQSLVEKQAAELERLSEKLGEKK